MEAFWNDAFEELASLLIVDVTVHPLPNNRGCFVSISPLTGGTARLGCMWLLAVVVPLCLSVQHPCPSFQIPVTSFASSSDFNETAPITFGGELYVRATVLINRYTSFARVFDFLDKYGERDTDIRYGLIVSQIGVTGKLVLYNEYRNADLAVSPVPLGQPFLLEVAITRDSPFSDMGVAVMYVNSEEYVRGNVRLPPEKTRNSNYVGRSHVDVDADLDGSVSDFLLTQCVLPDLPKPCDNPTPVTSFVSSSEFNETAPITFGGELYVRATVLLNSYTSSARVFAFMEEQEGVSDTRYGFVLAQDGMSGKFILSNEPKTGQPVVYTTTQAPLGVPFVLEVTITRDSTSTDSAVAVIYINSQEHGRGAVLLLPDKRWNDNYIGRSHVPSHALLNGSVSDFLLSRCTPPVPKPCDKRMPVTSFTTSSDFNETAPITFGGEMYMRAIVKLDSYTMSKLVDFRGRAGDKSSDIVMQVQTTGLSVFLNSGAGESRVQASRQLPLDQPFLLEVTTTRDSPSSVDGSVAIYVNGEEYGRGPALMPPLATWNSNYIGHSHTLSDAVLEGSVSDFQLWQCLPPVPKPCEKPMLVTSFTTSSDFNETAPITFGGELYVRANVLINSTTNYGSLFDFRTAPTQNAFVISQLGMTGKLMILTDVDRQLSVEGTYQVPLGRPFLLELTITRDSALSGMGMAVMYINGIEYSRGAVAVPTAVRNINYIGRSHEPTDPHLDGSVSDFLMSQCVLPPVPKPCDTPIPVTSFTTSSDFSETAPITFGGELYVRATVFLNMYSFFARVFDFIQTEEGSDELRYGLVLAQLGEDGRLILYNEYSNVPTDRPVPLGVPFVLEVTITRDSLSSNRGVAVIYINSQEHGRGPVSLPPEKTRNSNYIGRSHIVSDAQLEGSVSDFLLSQCFPPVPKPCDKPTSVASFASSSEFNETAPITFGGELYVRATVLIKSYTPDARVFDFATDQVKYDFVVSELGTTGKLVFETDGTATHDHVEGTAQVPLGQPFLLELTIARDSAFSGTGVAVMYVNGQEHGSGAVTVPNVVRRNSNYVRHSLDPQDLSLSLSVSDFLLSQCTPPVAKPCDTPTPVTSFTTSSDFSETAPITFGGELYMRATVLINRYTPNTRILDFAAEQGTYGFVISQLGRTGKLVFETDGAATHESVEGTYQVPLGRPFLLELTITRDSPFSDRGVAVMYVNSVLYRRGNVTVPAVVRRASNYIGHSHAPQDLTSLDGSVSDFILSQCLLPPVPKPCDNLIPMTSFTASSDFNETAPITFGGELYVRAIIRIDTFHSWATVFDLGRNAGQDSFRVMNAGSKLVLVVFRGLLWHSLDCSPLPSAGVAFLLEATITRADGPPGSGLGAVFINGVECGRGALPLPRAVVRSSNAIKRSRSARGTSLDGVVRDFLLSRCTPPVPKPCDKPTPVVSFASSSDFNETAPITFGGELYVRATVLLNSNVMQATVWDFAQGLGQDSVRLIQDRTSGAPRLLVFRGLLWRGVSCTAQPPLHQPFTLEATITRAGSSGGGVAVVYMDGVECGRGAVHLPRDVVRSSNFIARNRTPQTPLLGGTVSDFQLSVCL